jgi:hypothetical protein
MLAYVPLQLSHHRQHIRFSPSLSQQGFRIWETMGLIDIISSNHETHTICFTADGPTYSCLAFIDLCDFSGYSSTPAKASQINTIYVVPHAIFPILRCSMQLVWLLTACEPTTSSPPLSKLLEPELLFLKNMTPPLGHNSVTQCVGESQ